MYDPKTRYDMKKVHILLLTAMLACTGIRAQRGTGATTVYGYNCTNCKRGLACDYHKGIREDIHLSVPSMQYNLFGAQGLRSGQPAVQKGNATHHVGLYEGKYTNAYDPYVHMPLMLSYTFRSGRVQGWFDVGTCVTGQEVLQPTITPPLRHEHATPALHHVRANNGVHVGIQIHSK